jgi:hypothetical protein
MSFVMLATAASAAAQSSGTMSKGMSDGAMDKMQMPAKAASYTGCVEKDAKTGAFSLSHVASAGATMSGGASMDKGKDKDANAMWLGVTSKDIDLNKHVGHKVTVVGSGAMPMAMGHDMNAMASDKGMAMKASFVVKTLTMVSSGCQ